MSSPDGVLKGKVAIVTGAGGVGNIGAQTARLLAESGARVVLADLNGTELDYKETLMQSGFVLQNPNVKRTCGCGASFTV